MTEKIREQLYQIMELNLTTSSRYLIAKEVLLSLSFNQELTISQLSQNAHTSRSSITRFFQSLDFHGLKDFVKAVNDEEVETYFALNSKMGHQAYKTYFEMLQANLNKFSLQEPTIVKLTELLHLQHELVIFADFEFNKIFKSFASKLAKLKIKVINGNKMVGQKIPKKVNNKIILFISLDQDNETLIKFWNEFRSLGVSFLLTTTNNLADFSGPNYQILFNKNDSYLDQQLQLFLLDYFFGQLINLLTVSQNNYL